MTIVYLDLQPEPSSPLHRTIWGNFMVTCRSVFKRSGVACLRALQGKVPITGSWGSSGAQMGARQLNSLQMRRSLHSASLLLDEETQEHASLCSGIHVGCMLLRAPSGKGIPSLYGFFLNFDVFWVFLMLWVMLVLVYLCVLVSCVDRVLLVL